VAGSEKVTSTGKCICLHFPFLVAMRGQKGCTLECVPPSLIYILTVSLETILGYILLWDMQFLTVLLGMSKAVLRFLISAIILYWEMIALE